MVAYRTLWFCSFNHIYNENITKMTKFKIYPEKGNKQYYSVIIFDKKADMIKYSCAITKRPLHLFEAVAHSYYAYYKRNKKYILSKQIGSILFYKNGFGVGTVAHEIAHATNYYFNRKKIKFRIGNVIKPTKQWFKYDEAYAHILGYMINQFWNKYNGKVKTKSEKY